MTQATPLCRIDVSFLVSTDLVNKCGKFEACSFSRFDYERFQMIWSIVRFLGKPRPLNGTRNSSG